jgi:hypothetical protein
LPDRCPADDSSRHGLLLGFVAAVDFTGNQAESDVAETLRRVESVIEEDEHVERAVLTLATADQPSLQPPTAA